MFQAIILEWIVISFSRDGKSVLAIYFIHSCMYMSVSQFQWPHLVAFDEEEEQLLGTVLYIRTLFSFVLHFQCILVQNAGGTGS